MSEIVLNSYTRQFHSSSGSLCHMPLQRPISTHFVLERDEFNKASRLVVRNLPPKIKWAGYVQCGLLIALMLTGIAFSPANKMQPVSLVIFILVWLVFLTNLIAHRAWTELRFSPMSGNTVPQAVRQNRATVDRAGEVVAGAPAASAVLGAQRAAVDGAARL